MEYFTQAFQRLRQKKAFVLDKLFSNKAKNEEIKSRFFELNQQFNEKVDILANALPEIEEQARADMSAKIENYSSLNQEITEEFAKHSEQEESFSNSNTEEIFEELLNILDEKIQQLWDLENIFTEESSFSSEIQNSPTKIKVKRDSNFEEILQSEKAIFLSLSKDLQRQKIRLNLS